nr:hypothetical protein [Desulforamulus aquiferis]
METALREAEDAKWVPGHGRPGKPEVNTMFTRRRPIFARSKGLALSTAERGVVRDY